MRLSPFLLLVIPCLLSAQEIPSDPPVARCGQLHVEGTQLTSARGEPVTLRGMSLFDTSSYGEYANPAVLAWLRDDWKATIFRAAMYTEYNGKFVGEAAYQPLFSAVQAAIDTGMYVLVDWHILTDGNPLKHLTEAKDFFTRVATRFGRYPNVLYEICNEPNGKGVTWAEAIKPYALEVIPAIRTLAPDSVIIVGTPVWSSEPEVAAADPLPFPNVMYTLHFYAGTHDRSFLDKIDQARSAGAAVFVTEWGTTNAQVTGTLFVPRALAWAAGLAERRISWANWSLGTKLEPASALKPLANPAGSWRAGELTESGLLMRSLLRDETTAVVFADSFDSGNFKASGWLRSGAMLEKDMVFSGTGSVRFEGVSSLTKVLLSEGYRTWSWSFQARGQDWKPGDRFLVEWSLDGKAWTPQSVVTTPSATWVKVAGSLPAELDRRPGVQVRFRSEFAQDSRYWIDDIEFQATRD
jgi:aryl-phospho-beta-D-glucosidase BglC (GH1 family)